MLSKFIEKLIDGVLPNKTITKYRIVKNEKTNEYGVQWGYRYDNEIQIDWQSPWTVGTLEEAILWKNKRENDEIPNWSVIEDEKI